MMSNKSLYTYTGVKNLNHAFDAEPALVGHYGKPFDALAFRMKGIPALVAK
jgi:hypothetical protein